MDPNEVSLWIDSFLFSKSGLKPTAIDLKIRFGPGSPTHTLAIDELNNLWRTVESENEVQLKAKLWIKNMRIVYGNEPLINAFLDHTYLVTIVKILVYLRLRKVFECLDQIEFFPFETTKEKCRKGSKIHLSYILYIIVFVYHYIFWYFRITEIYFFIKYS
jgi:hypothetical protein